jgi:hypothetical protein
MRNIEIRLRKLEAKLNPPEKPVVIGLAVVANALPRERKKNLAPGARVVIDWYRNVNGVSWGRERISTDPADEGRHCRRGGLPLRRDSRAAPGLLLPCASRFVFHLWGHSGGRMLAARI